MSILSPICSLQASLLYDLYAPKGYLSRHVVKKYIFFCSSLRQTNLEMRNKIDFCWEKFLEVLRKGRFQYAPSLMPLKFGSSLKPSHFNILINFLNGTPHIQYIEIKKSTNPQLSIHNDKIELIAFKVIRGEDVLIRYCHLTELSGTHFEFKKLSLINYFSGSSPALSFQGGVLLVFSEKKYLSLYKIYQAAEMALFVPLAFPSFSFTPVMQFIEDSNGGYLPMFTKDIKPIVVGEDVFIIFRDTNYNYILKTFNIHNLSKYLSSITLPMEKIRYFSKFKNDLIFGCHTKLGIQIAGLPFQELLNENLASTIVIKFSNIVKGFDSLCAFGALLATYKENQLKFSVIDIGINNIKINEPITWFKSFSYIHLVYFFEGKVFTVGDHDNFQHTCLVAFDLKSGLTELNFKLPLVDRGTAVQVVPSTENNCLHILYQETAKDNCSVVTINYALRSNMNDLLTLDFSDCRLDDSDNESYESFSSDGCNTQ